MSRTIRRHDKEKEREGCLLRKSGGKSCRRNLRVKPVSPLMRHIYSGNASPFLLFVEASVPLRLARELPVRQEVLVPIQASAPVVPVLRFASNLARGTRRRSACCAGGSLDPRHAPSLPSTRDSCAVTRRKSTRTLVLQPNAGSKRGAVPAPRAADSGSMRIAREAEQGYPHSSRL